MKRLRPSLALVLIALPLLLNAESLRANGSVQEKLDQETNNSTTQHKNTNAAPAPPGEPVIEVRDSAPNPNTSNTKSSQDECYEILRLIYCRFKAAYDWGTVPDWLLVVAAIITGYYVFGAFRAAHRQAEAAEKQLDFATSARNWLLRVTGHLTYRKEVIEYCYKYYAYPQPRPKDLPQFAP